MDSFLATMWALRRLSVPLRYLSLSLRFSPMVVAFNFSTVWLVRKLEKMEETEAQCLTFDGFFFLTGKMDLK